MITLTELAQKLKKEKKIAIFCHVRPDGDTIGSSLGLAFALNGNGIPTDVYCADAIPSKFSFLPDVNKISNTFKGEYTALVAVDCADIQRLGEFGETFFNHKNTYNVDHHISNTRYAKINYVADNGANAENIFMLSKALDYKMTKDCANALLMGMVTDTGGFRHKNVTQNTLTFAGELLACGGDINKIIYNMFSAQSKARAKLFGTVMSKIRYFKDDRIGVASVSLNDVSASGARQDETEGFIDFLMGVDTVEVGACVLEIEKDKYKISLRSKGTDVNAVASTFGGGGHTLASGCQISGEYEEVIDKITSAISRFMD